MKRNKYIAIATVLFSISMANAQSVYDAARIMDSQLNGTARYVGMGGAMGALGGDITTMGTNPAGTGIYRSNDVMVTFGFANEGIKSSDQGMGNHRMDKVFGSFDNAGALFAFKYGNKTPLRFVNFGFNYRRINSFNRNTFVSGVHNASQTDQMAGMLNGAGLSPNVLEAADAYSDYRLPWLGLLGYDSYLVSPGMAGEESFGGYNPYFGNFNTVENSYKSRERGGSNAFDFNVSTNLFDRLYIGATLGVYSVNYSRSSSYTEDFFGINNNDPGGYRLNNRFGLSGAGVDFALGIIARPFESSPLRIGVSVHTPSLYHLREYGHASIDYDVDVLDGEDVSPISGNTFTQDANGNSMESETAYQLRTPWKYNFSLGYTIGRFVALGAEYELQNMGAGRMLYDDGMDMEVENQDVKDMLKRVHTFKVGAEFKLLPVLSLRLGYNYVSPMMDKNAFKGLANNSVRTDTEYANINSSNTGSIGLGFRKNKFYMDLAYLYSHRTEEFYAFDSVDLEGNSMTSIRHKALLTIGVRF